MNTASFPVRDFSLSPRTRRFHRPSSHRPSSHRPSLRCRPLFTPTQRQVGWRLTTTISIAVALAAFTGCASTQDGAGGPSPADYLPLAVGHAWTYEVKSPGSPPITERIEILRQNADGFYVDSKGTQLKARADGIFDGKRYLLEAPLQVGHKWLAVPSPTEVERYEIVGLHERITVGAGKFDECIRVLGTLRTHLQNGTPATLTTEWAWAKGVGLIRMKQSVVIANTPAVEGISLSLTKVELEGAD